MNKYQALTCLGEEESFLGKKAGDRVGVGGCNEDEATSHQDQGPFVNSTFFWPAFASATTRINLQKFASIWTISSYLKALDSMREQVICCGEVCMPVCF